MPHMKHVLFVLTLAIFATAAVAAPGRFSVGGSVGLQLPMGAFADSYGAGFGVHGSCVYNVCDDWEVTGQFGWNHWGIKNTQNGVVSGGFTTLPLLFGARYVLQQGTLHVYGGVETGLHFSSASASVNGGAYGDLASSYSETNVGLTPLAGILVPISATLNFDGNLRYNIIFTSGSSTTYIGVNAGVSYPLP